MPTILITGSSGFMGTHLCLALRRMGGVEVLEFDVQQTANDLPKLIERADWVFHLAGVNRPKDEQEFVTGNTDLTRQLCDALVATGRPIPVVLSSSIQAGNDNPYGRSKKAAEDVVLGYHQATGAPVFIFRFPNVFGKWSRPNYNTVVATFCHNISRGLPIQISNRSNTIQFVYIDDIIASFLRILADDKDQSDLRPLTSDLSPLQSDLCPLTSDLFPPVSPTYTISLGELHDLLVSFRENRRRMLVPELTNQLVKYLYATYISFYDKKDFAYPVELRTDNRGWLFELIKSPHAGQIFVSRTHPGITRGNHYHDTKVEKFCVIQGEGIIRFRHVLDEKQGAGSREQGAAARDQKSDISSKSDLSSTQSDLRPPTSDLSPLQSDLRPLTSDLCLSSPVIEYPVNDRDIQIVDIPPGYTHSIENTGAGEMITIFWANEIFNPEKPDTYFLPVLKE